jgi:Gas vesicle synthesis protein GvpL/GvpF
VTGRDGDRLAALAEGMADDVLADALARAREQATARLADLLTDAIVARALVTAPSRPAAESAPPATGPTDDHGEVLYAYGITSAGSSPPEDVGVPVELIRDDGLGLLVSRARPAELRVDADDLSETGRLAVLARRHDAVVRSAVGGSAVLPLRFGTVVPDEAAARRLLREHGPAARARLARIADAREWGVRLVRALPAEPSAAGETDAATGTEYLSRRRTALREKDDAAREAAHCAELLEQALTPHAVQALRRGGSPGSSLLLDMAYLVPPAAEPGFLAAVDQLRADLAPQRLTVETTGPWPPYSFASLDEGTGRDA